MPNYQKLSGQNYLIEFMTALGHKIDKAGICFGLAHMAKQAFFLKDLKTLNNRIDVIRKIGVSAEKKATDEIKRKYNFDPTSEEFKNEDQYEEYLKIAHKEMRDSLEAISPSDRINMNAFCDGIHVYQDLKSALPEFDFAKGVCKTEHETTVKSAPLIMQEALQKKGGVDRFADFSCDFSEQELGTYIMSLDDLSKRENEQRAKDIGFVFIANNHAIFVGFSPPASWVIFDANNLPMKEPNDAKETAHDVCSFLWSKELERAFLGRTRTSIAVDLYSEHKYAKEMEEMKLNLNHAIQYAVKEKNLEVVISLLPKVSVEHIPFDTVYQLFDEKKADFGTKLNDLGDTFLHLSARTNRGTEILKKLLDKKMDPNFKRMKDHVTLLQLAALNGCSDSVKLLISKGANVNLGRKGDGQTPLDNAVCRGELDIAELLLKHSAPETIRRTASIFNRIFSKMPPPTSTNPLAKVENYNRMKEMLSESMRRIQSSPASGLAKNERR
jgi:hypothetical protein